jgi:hypothetical protein
MSRSAQDFTPQAWPVVPDEESAESSVVELVDSSVVTVVESSVVEVVSSVVPDIDSVIIGGGIVIGGSVIAVSSGVPSSHTSFTQICPRSQCEFSLQGSPNVLGIGQPPSNNTAESLRNVRTTSPPSLLDRPSARRSTDVDEHRG